MKTVKTKIWSVIVFILLTTLSYAQNIVVSEENLTVQHIITLIEQQSNLSFAYASDQFDVNKVVRIKPNTYKVEGLISMLFPDDQYRYRIENNTVLVRLNRTPKQTISGYITDLETGEELIGAIISIPNTSIGVSTNAYGFYSITIPSDQKQLKVSYIGYIPFYMSTDGSKDQMKNIQLKPSEQQLEEIVITIVDTTKYEAVDQNVENISITKVRTLPSLAGEVDLVKAIQLLPGVSTKGEGASNFMVRGGTPSQNLILLDEATIYNPSHLMGFFSVFNSDAIKDMKFYRSSFPAAYGNRLSSVLDIRMKEGNNKKLGVSGGIGTVASRILLEGPIQKNKSSFLITGRRTYMDLAFKLSSDEFTRQSALYFYDFNAKANYKLNDKNRLFISGYFGQDVIRVRSLKYNIHWGNATATMRWNHIFNSHLFSNTTFLYSNYNYKISLPRGKNPFDWQSDIEEFKLKSNFTYYRNPKSTVHFGGSSSLMNLNSGSPITAASPFEPIPSSKINLNSTFVQHEHKISNRFEASYGLRVSNYNLLAPYIDLNQSDQNTWTEDTTKDGIAKTYNALEPRLSLSYKVNQNAKLKFNYSKNVQFLNMLSNSVTSFSVFDVWYPSNNKIKPSKSHNYGVGVVMGHPEKGVELSSEIYYRTIKNQLDFADHSKIIMNKYIESTLRFGNAEAYGIEIALQKGIGNFQGNISYTFSRVFYDIPEINNGKRYRAAHDQPHNIKTNFIYKPSSRVSLSANWVYNTGYAITLPKEVFVYDGYVVPVYGEKNASRVPDYHRLDLSLVLNRKQKEKQKNDANWVFSVYNVYSRYNALVVFVGPEMSDISIVKDPNNIMMQKLTLFGAVPSITYNFKF